MANIHRYRKIRNVILPEAPTHHLSTDAADCTAAVTFEPPTGWHVLRYKARLSIVHISDGVVTHLQDHALTDLDDTVYDEMVPISLPFTSEQLKEILS